MKQVTKNPLRCECRRQPLLAMYGVDEKGQPYLHVRVYKARRIYGEILVVEGKVQLRCRECYRWFTVTVHSTKKPSLVETEEPEEMEEVLGG